MKAARLLSGNCVAASRSTSATGRIVRRLFKQSLSPKLDQINFASKRRKVSPSKAPDAAGPASYLNDVRIYPDGKYVYMTVSGLLGGWVVTDLMSGKA